MRLSLKLPLQLSNAEIVNRMRALQKNAEWFLSIYSSPLWYRCMVGTCAAGIGGALSLILLAWFTKDLEYSFFYPAVMLGSLLGGITSGAAALVFSLIQMSALFSPEFNFFGASKLLIFMGSCIAVSLASEAMHKTTLNVLINEKRRADMEALVRETIDKNPSRDQIGEWEYNCETNLSKDLGNTRKLTGLTEEMVMSPETTLAIMVAEDRAATHEAMIKSLNPAGTGIYEAEYRIIRPVDGKECWIASRGQAYFKNGTPDRLMGVCTDITEKKRIEQIAKEKAQLALQLETIASALPCAIYSLRHENNGKITCPYSAPSISEIVGLCPHDLLLNATDVYKNIHKDDFETFKTNFFHSKHEMTVWTDCFRFYHPKKGMIWLETQAAPVKEADGSVIWHGYVQDVTLRKQAETRLAESEERFRAVIEGAGDAIISINEVGVIQSANLSGIKMFQYSEAELVGQNVQILMTEPDKNRHDYYLQNFASQRKKPVRFTREFIGQRKDGSVFPLELSVSEARYDSTRLIVGFIRDLTELRKVKAHVEKLQTERLTAMGGMAAGLSHEINQPLSAAAAYLQTAQLLLDMPPEQRPDDARGMLGLAADQVVRAGRIVSQLRKFIVLGEPDKIFYSLHELLHQIDELMSDYAQRAHIDLIFKLNAPDDRVLIDPVQINQVLMNLIRNAIQAMKDSIKRELIVETNINAEAMLQVDVIDYGDGLNKETEANLFVPFTTTKADGMGLGLSISRSIIEAHHGTIWTSPNPAGGTVFSFTLPLACKGEADVH